MSHKEISKGNNFLTCENNISLNDTSNSKEFFEIATKLKILFLVIDDMSIKTRTSFLESIESDQFSLITANSIYDKIKSEGNAPEKLKYGIKKLLSLDDKITCLFASRKTIRDTSIDKIKKQLGSIRNQYEIISLFSKDKNTLKWASQDRRIDYITIEILENSEFIDQPLCSVVKQNGKIFEINLSSLINTKTDRELSEVLRKGKKLMKLIYSTNAPFVYAMNPKSPLEFRTGSQMRLLGSLLESSYNKTRTCVFDKQLEVLVSNTIKLDESHIVEGIREV